MAQVQGHSIEEQWDLSEQFEALTEHAIAQTIETYLALTTRQTLTAADVPGLGDTPTSVYTLWEKQVDSSLGPFVYATFQSAALNVAHGVLNTSDLPPGVGVPGVSDDFTASYVAQVKNKMVGVSDDLWSEINLELQKGVAANEGIEELADRVRVAGATTTVRANAVARTTVLQASNAGSLSQALLLGDSGVTKEWLATEDMRTRPTHAHADGQKRSLDEAFDVGGFPLQYPGDPAGPAGEVINCRCTLVYNFDSPPTHVCDCVGTSAEALAAASYLTTPTTVSSSSCVCPVTASLTPPGYISPVSSYGPLAQQGIYQQFQKPSKISPAYGGAKIHKQLEPIKTALGLTDADTEALLDLIDHQYVLAHGKSSFKEKYEEWLNSAAGKKVVKIPVSVPSPVGLTPPPAATSVVTSTVADIRGLPVIPSPAVADLKVTASAGGSHGAKFVVDTKTGEKWVFKPYSATSEEFGAKLEVSMARLQSRVGLSQPSTYTIRLDGKYGSLQSMHDATDAFPGGVFNPLKLSAADVLDIQEEQVFDWLVSNHDSHAGNFLRLTNGHLVGVDKGQAYKFFGKDKLNWSYHPNKMEKEPVYNLLWRAYAEGKNVPLVDPSTDGLKDLIDRAMGVSDDELRKLLRPYAEQALKDGKLAYGDLDKFYQAALKRKNNLAQDFQSLYDRAVAERAKNLGTAVTAPVAPVAVAPTVAAPAFDVANLVNKVATDFDMTSHGILRNIIKDINYALSKGTDFDAAWAAKQPYLSSLPHFKALTPDERLQLVKAYKVKYPTPGQVKFNVDTWPDTLAKAPFDVTSIDIANLSPSTVTHMTAQSVLEQALDEIAYQVHTSIFPDTLFKDIWSNIHVGPLRSIPELANLTDEEMMKFLKHYVRHEKLHYPIGTWPDSLSLGGKASTGGGTTVGTVGVPSAPAVTPAVATTTVTTPTIVVPATVTTPATVDLLDISTVPWNDKADLLKAFKAVKPVTPNWGGSAIMKTLAQAKTSLGPSFAKYSDGQLLKMLDEAAKSSGKTYFDEATTWLKTPSGKKYTVTTGTPSIPAGTGTTTTVTVTTATVPTVPTAATVTGALGDISGIDAAVQKQVFSKFKGHGVYLSSPGSKIWDTLQILKKDPAYQHLTDLQLIRVVDAVGAQNLGVANVNLYEQKLVEWMKTKPGKDYIAGIKPVKVTKITPSYSPSTYTPPAKITVNVPPLTRNISSTDTTFNVIYNSEAQTLQNSWAPWTSTQSTALRYYTSNAGYTAMNKLLRDEIGTSTTLAKVKQAQAGMRPSTQPMMLHRGTGTKQFGLGDNAPLADVQALVGKTLEDKGFMSTSVGGSAAFSGQPVIIEFEAPTGTHMAYVKSISHYSTENEMLLAAGTRYKVLSVTKPGRQIIVRVRIVP